MEDFGKFAERAKLSGRFIELTRARLSQGDQAYAGVSFSLSPRILDGELGEEFLDVAGWAYVAYEGKGDRHPKYLRAARDAYDAWRRFVSA